MKKEMKDILKKLSENENRFPCTWKEEANFCKILSIDFQTSQALVRFETPVKKIIRVESEEPSFSEEQPMVEKEIISNEEWITI